jgi:hypothetical protein
VPAIYYIEERQILLLKRIIQRLNRLGKLSDEVAKEMIKYLREAFKTLREIYLYDAPETATALNIYVDRILQPYSDKL